MKERRLVEDDLRRDDFAEKRLHRLLAALDAYEEGVREDEE